MKTLLLISIFLLNVQLHTQSVEIDAINKYADSIDNIISSSSGLPGEITSNTITTNRNVRAIGPQKTLISFYFIQADDIAHEDSTGMIFIPVHNFPLKILVEYNIAASQNVKISYYHDRNGNLMYRNFDSKGAYGDRYFKQWYSGNELLAVEIFEDGKKMIFDKSGEIPAEEINTSIVTRKFSDMYLDMYYDLFRFEQIDK